MGRLTSEFLGDVLGVAQDALGRRHEEKARRQAEALYENQAQAGIARLRQAQEIEEKRRRDQLRRALAGQRARFAALGLRPAGGSAGAVLAGLEAEAAAADAAGRALVDSRTAEIRDELDWRRRRNLLARSAVRARNVFDSLRGGFGADPLLPLY
jgi:hypothetical protein